MAATSARAKQHDKMLAKLQDLAESHGLVVVNKSTAPDTYSSICDATYHTIRKDDDSPIFAFHGFNIEAIKKHIMKCAYEHKRTEHELFRDIALMVDTGLHFSNVREDLLEFMSPNPGVEKIKEVAYMYKIPIRSSANEKIELKRDSLTFVRALSCFPDFTSVVLLKAGHARNGESSVLASEQLPDVMKHVAFSGLIPKICDEYLIKAYLYAHVAYMVDLANKTYLDDERTLKAKALSQLNACKVGMKKIPFPDQFRAGMLRYVGLTDPAAFKKILAVCNNLCKVVGEPEISFETAKKYHIKNNMICFYEDGSKDVAACKVAKEFADKVVVDACGKLVV